MNSSPPGSSVYTISPGKNTEMGFYTLLQGIFPTQELNQGLPHHKRILYLLGHEWSHIYSLVAFKLLFLFVCFGVGVVFICLLALWAQTGKSAFKPLSDIPPYCSLLCQGMGFLLIPGLHLSYQSACGPSSSFCAKAVPSALGRAPSFSGGSILSVSLEPTCLEKIMSSRSFYFCLGPDIFIFETQNIYIDGHYNTK